jgi:hypothetical protein
MKRIETTIAFNIARRVSNHRPEESTVWNPDKVLANHRETTLAPAPASKDGTIQCSSFSDRVKTFLLHLLSGFAVCRCRCYDKNISAHTPPNQPVRGVDFSTIPSMLAVEGDLERIKAIQQHTGADNETGA